MRLTFSRAFGPLSFWVNDTLLGCDAMERFAQADGFGNEAEPIAVLDMAAFWFAAHGRGVDEIDFRGFLIAWRSLSQEALPCG